MNDRNSFLELVSAGLVAAGIYHIIYALVSWALRGTP